MSNRYGIGGVVGHTAGLKPWPKLETVALGRHCSFESGTMPLSQTWGSSVLDGIETTLTTSAPGNTHLILEV